jgi:hypothetical protein
MLFVTCRCGSRVVQALKTLKRHGLFIMVWASEPYVQQYGVFFVFGMLN